MDRVRQIGGWTVDFQGSVAYLRLSDTEILRVDKEGRYGILNESKVLPCLLPIIKRPSFDMLENLPFVERFESRRLIIR